MRDTRVQRKHLENTLRVSRVTPARVGGGDRLTIMMKVGKFINFIESSNIITSSILKISIFIQKIIIPGMHDFFDVLMLSAAKHQKLNF